MNVMKYLTRKTYQDWYDDNKEIIIVLAIIAGWSLFSFGLGAWIF